MMPTIESKLILGLAGTTLSTDEQRWLATSPPAGVILFARNIESPDQVRTLLTAAKDAAGDHLWAAIDEEGGRVNRIPWPPFCERPAAASYGQRYRNDANQAVTTAYADAKRCGEGLATLGFSHNCAPILDLYHPQADKIIGARAYSDDPAIVSALGRAVMEGLQAGGIEAVGKHFPGHGRANCDSHLSTPTVALDHATLLAEARPFADLISNGLHHVMTAHVHYPQQDRTIASCSHYWLQQILRQEFSFTGMIWSDDLSMGGAGDDLAMAISAANRAGCDRLLVCQPKDCTTLFRGEINLYES
ncbi:MAG: beta-N-acetylhexosaminidase [Mariprofundales bacterium]|nr:beta-N-acetylhexosaminidase [Mariprofundales bacterium]